MDAKQMEELIRKIPSLTKHEERSGFNPWCAKCLAEQAIKEMDEEK